MSPLAGRQLPLVSYFRLTLALGLSKTRHTQQTKKIRRVRSAHVHQEDEAGTKDVEVTTTKRWVTALVAGLVFLVVALTVQAVRGEFGLSDLLIQFAVFVAVGLGVRWLRRRSQKSHA